MVLQLLYLSWLRHCKIIQFALRTRAARAHALSNMHYAKFDGKKKQLLDIKQLSKDNLNKMTPPPLRAKAFEL